MPEQLKVVLARLLAKLTETELPNADGIANLLSEHAIFIEELGEEERELVDRFLQDAFAISSAKEKS